MRTILGLLGGIPRPTRAMGVTLLALLIAASGAAVAAIPSSDGTITASRDNRSGTIRVINAGGGQTCTSRETKLSWKDGSTLLGKNDKAADSDKLDGQDSTAFGVTMKTNHQLTSERDTLFPVSNECAPVTVAVPTGKQYHVMVWSPRTGSGATGTGTRGSVKAGFRRRPGGSSSR
jgi:hypothetical protein